MDQAVKLQRRHIWEEDPSKQDSVMYKFYRYYLYHLSSDIIMWEKTYTKKKFYCNISKRQSHEHSEVCCFVMKCKRVCRRAPVKKVEPGDFETSSEGWGGRKSKFM